MSRKDYVAMARAMADIRPIGIGLYDPALVQWAKDVDAIAETFKVDNPRFDRGRFLVAAYA